MAYKQARSRKKRLKKTYDQIKNMNKHYSPGGVWIDEDRGFLYRFHASNTPGYTKSIRRVSNKKVRRASEPMKHGDYRKVYDYKWTIL